MANSWHAATADAKGTILTGWQIGGQLQDVATSVEQHLARAIEAQRSGRRSEAIRELDEALRLDPNHPHAHNMRGMDVLNAGDPETASHHFATAARADPTAGPLWLNLAKARRQLGDDAGERQALESALEADQRNLMALVRLAQLHERLGQYGDATIRWSGVTQLANEHPGAPADLQAIFDHARAFLAERNNILANAIAADIGEEISSALPRDRRRLTAAVDHMLGRRTIYANRCFGMYYPFLPADEFFDRELFPWLSALEAQTGTIRSELESLLNSTDPGLAPYVAMPPGTPENIWSELNNNRAWSALHLWKEGIRIEGACARAPLTAKIVEALPLARVPGRAPSVFFSILQAGKHIPPHSGVTNTRTIIHLPLIVPEGCTFRVGGEIRSWREGEAFAFDDTIEHEAWNRSDQDRAVLILDCWNPHLSDYEQMMISRLLGVADAAKTR